MATDRIKARVSPKRMIAVRPLSAAAFQPFGEVIEHVGTAPRHTITSAFETDGRASERSLWVYRLPEPGRLPMQVTTMERHPHSAQFFIPLSCRAFLVAACPSHDNGEPDMDELAAFVAYGGQGIVYRSNIWHHPMVALGGPAVFAVSLARGCPDDSVSVGVDGCVMIAAMSEQIP